MKHINGFFKLLYWPICRAYAKHSMPGDEPADRIMSFLCSLDFWLVHGYWPHNKNPRSFEEKLLRRMLHERDPRLTLISDKWKVRDFVASKVGHEYLIPVHWTGNNPEEIPFDGLPSKFVIKTNHGCGYNIIVKDKTKLNLSNTKLQLKKWLGENFGQDRLLGTAWAYKNISPTIIVESFLEDNKDVPSDYKFLCFSGRAEFLQMNIDRFGNPYEKTFDRDFNPLDLWQGTRQYPEKVVPPDNYEEMVKVAETLAQNWDFLRIDQYNVGGRIYIGELTCYAGGGRIKWIPSYYDFLLGDKWKEN